MTDLLEFAQAMSRPGPRMGRPPGSPPPRIDWKDPAQKREYKAAQQRERKAQQIAELLAAGVKSCNRCRVEKPFDQYEPDERKSLGIRGICKACLNQARQQRYYQQEEREQTRSRNAYTQHRAHAIAIYGGHCELCGDTRKLEFDHVNWDGSDHRKMEDPHTMVVRIAKTGARISDHQLRLVCGPCHRALRPAFTRRMLALRIAGSKNWPIISI